MNTFIPFFQLLLKPSPYKVDGHLKKSFMANDQNKQIGRSEIKKKKIYRSIFFFQNSVLNGLRNGQLLTFDFTSIDTYSCLY